MWNRASLVLNGALATAVVLISRRLCRVEAELARVTALTDAGTQSAEPPRSGTSLPSGHTAMTNDGAGDMTDLAAAYEQAILPADS